MGSVCSIDNILLHGMVTLVHKTGMIVQMLQLLYDMDFVGEESFLDWAEEKKDGEEEEKRFIKLAQPFLDWLEEAEEDSDEEEESD